MYIEVLKMRNFAIIFILILAGLKRTAFFNFSSCFGQLQLFLSVMEISVAINKLDGNFFYKMIYCKLYKYGSR